MTWTCETWNAKPFMHLIGARVTETAGGHSRLELPVEAHHRGAADTEAVNGAALAYLHDVAQGAAVRSLCGADVVAIATLNLNVSYITYAAAADLLVCTGEVIRMHGAVAFARSVFRAGDGAPYCEATGTFRVLRRPRRARAA